MKLRNKVLILISSLLIQSTFSKNLGQQPVAPNKQKQIPQQQIQKPSQPIQQKKQQPMQQHMSYAQALNVVKNMPHQQVIANNMLTQNFVNFVMSLNLPTIQTKALLEAGAYAHASWTGNNQQDQQISSMLKNNINAITQNVSPIQKQSPSPQQQVKPSTPQKVTPTPQTKKPAPQKEHITPQTLPSQNAPSLYNLILLMDPQKVETFERYGNAMVGDALMGMYEQVAPIIMTTNVLEIIMTIRQKIGDKNLQQLRQSGFNNVQQLAQQLTQQAGVHESPLQVILMSLINFDAQQYYFHTSEQLVLVIPQQYLISNISNAAKLNANEQIKACGFNPAVLTQINNATTENILQQLRKQSSKPINLKQFINNLSSLFIPEKEDGELISPSYNVPWLIYISGHGGPFYLQTGNYIQVVPDKSSVAGVPLSEFSNLMRFFDASLNVEYIHYTTCFSGGYNQTFVNNILSSLDVDFLVSSEGLGEQETSGIPLGLSFSSMQPHIRLTYHPYTDFFKNLRMLVSNATEFAKIKKGKKEPLAPVLRALNPTEKQTNQAFVRFPGSGVFRAISTGKKTEIITRTVIKEHEGKNQPINLSSTDIDVVVIDVPRVTVPMTFGNNTDCGIVTPTVMTQFNQTIRMFTEINWNIPLQTLIFNFVRFNPKMDAQLFVVKKVNGISAQQSQLPSAKDNTASNVIIRIDGMMGIGQHAKPVVQTTPLTVREVPYAKLGVNVNVAFEWNNTVYSYMASIKTFDDLKEIGSSMQHIAFKSTTADNIVNKFLTQQEMSSIKKPITLGAIADIINARIDVQEGATRSKSKK